MKLLILGGGVAGSVAAQHAWKQGTFESISLLEKENYLGGIHRDVEVSGLHYDIGAFFFSSHHELVHVFPELTTDLLLTIGEYKFRSLMSSGNLDNYPPTASRYIEDNGVLDFSVNLLQLLVNRVKFYLGNNKFDSLDAKNRYLMGPFYEKMGLRSYIYRLYGIDPAEVSLEFSTKRLQYLDQRLTLAGIVSSISSKFQGKTVSSKFTGIPHEIYIRPKQGFLPMYDCILNLLRSRNVNVSLGVQIEKIFLKEKKVMTSDGVYHEYDYIISSIPLGLLCKLCEIPLSMKLRFKPLYSLFYECDAEPIPDSNVLFNFTDIGQWKRATFHSNAYGAESGRHYFVIESLPSEEQLQNPSVIDILDRDFRASFKNTRWAESVNNVRLVGSHLTPNAYPIYGKDFTSDVIDRLQETLSGNSIYLAGRQGTFDYITSSDAALSSIGAVDRIVKESTLK